MHAVTGRAPAGIVLRLRHIEPHPPVAAMLSALDPTERRRAARIADEHLRTTFVAGRSLLRGLAADLLGLDPSRLSASFTCPGCSPADGNPDHGRPGYSLDAERLPLALSLSRAGSRVLLAALDLRESLGGADGGTGTTTGIGIDLESVARVGFDGFDDVALDAAEARSIVELHHTDRAHGRALLWARKEALVKALGTGFTDRDPAAVTVLDDDRITDLTAVDGIDLARNGLVAAVAVVPRPGTAESMNARQRAGSSSANSHGDSNASASIPDSDREANARKSGVVAEAKRYSPDQERRSPKKASSPAAVLSECNARAPRL